MTNAMLSPAQEPGLVGGQPAIMARGWLAALVVLSLLGVSCGGAPSSSPASAAPVAVTGTETCEKIDANGSLEVWYTCVDSTSDARVSGTADVYVLLEEPTLPTAMSGTFKLANDNGSWEGNWSGDLTAESNHVMSAVLVGSGDYEGLQYRVRWEGAEEPLTITGTIEPAS